MKRVALGLAGLVLVGVGGCSLLLPEKYAVNGPVLSSLFGGGVDAPSEATVESRFRVAPGYQVGLFAEGIENARFMRFSPGGDLVISQPRAGRLLLVFGDRDGDGRSDGQRVLLEDLDRPHGFDFHAGALYVGEGSAITRIPYVESGPDTLAVAGEPVRIVEGIPEGGGHWSRTLRVGPDGLLYLSVGSSCNACEEEDPRRAAMLRFQPDGSGEEIYAAGLRNSVGFDWRPGTNELYATDNGRDLLGDDEPPCELNRIEQGRFYGWPYANGANRPDPDFGAGNADRIARSTPPAHGFRAHNAPLGITFVRHREAPSSHRGAAIVALHGSWNRTRLDGYRVVSLHWDDRGQITERDFLTGFEVDEDVIGRPVDVAEGPDGALYVSDDYAGAIYRVVGVESTAVVAPTTRVGASAKAAAPEASDPLAALSPADRVAWSERGAALYVENACGRCHLAAEATPGVVVKPLTDLRSKYGVESLASFFLTPQPPMPVFDLSQDDRRALAVHLLETAP